MKKIVLFFSFCLLAIAAKAQISTSPSSLCFTTPPGTTSDTQVVYVTVNIPSITPSRHLTITAPNAYMVSFDGVSWASSISTSALLADVTLNIPVYVNFHPTDSNSYPEGLLLSVEGIPIVDYPLCGNGSGPTISRFTADSFVVFIDEFCAGPQVTIAKNSYVAGQSVKTYFGDNTNQTMSLLPGSGGTAASVVGYHFYNMPGTYTLKSVLMNGTTAVDSVSYSYEYKFCRTLTAKFYYDMNANCTYDANTDYQNCLPILAEVDSNGIAIDTISATTTFYYSAYGLPGDVYTFRVLSLPMGLIASCPTTGILTDTLHSLVYNNPSQYLGMTCGTGSAFDLKVYTGVNTGRHMQTFDVNASNVLCTPVPAQLKFIFSPKYDFSGSYPSPTTVVGNVATWDLAAASLLTSLTHINITLKVPGAYLIPGDTINSEFVITPTVGDNDTQNNYCVRTDTVKSSYDPNEMVVTPSFCIPAGSATQLQYQVQFVNTGNDTAHNIYVMDTLDDNLNIRSFRILSSSALMNTAMYVAGGHNIIKFDFPNINLLDSSHYNQCEGTLIYNINTKDGLTAGTYLYNHAGIFFDDNPVVMTNTVANLAGCPSSVPQSALQSPISLYPNPATNQLIIKTDNSIYTSCTITSVMGQALLQQNLTTNQTTVNIANLPTGVYYVVFKGDNGEVVRKFVKM